MIDYHSRFLALVDEIETTFPVAEWLLGDVPVWPLARAELYLALYSQSTGTGRQSPQHGIWPRIAQATSFAATPLLNLWRSRFDLRHVVMLPRRANALFLGDGVSLDKIDGGWQDRFCDPLISAMESNGHTTLLMQQGDLRRLPWSRPTFSANRIDRWSRLRAAATGEAFRTIGGLPQHDRLLKWLDERRVPTRRLSETALRKRAAVVSSTADGFERVLRSVRPSLCFIVAYYAGVGHALALACRRQGVLSVDVQHDPHEGRHEAYRWLAVPPGGYAVLPAVFWNWTQEDADAIDAWTKNLTLPWHRSLHGGHPQLPAWFDDDNAQTRSFDAKIAEIRRHGFAELEILVALQSLEGYSAIWNELAALIEAAPSHWRWWLRRHPASRATQDPGLNRLLAIRKPNVLIDEASSLPLPALLRHMDAVLSLKSGAGVEASMFGVKPIFLSQEAGGLFPWLLKDSKAEIIDDMAALERRSTTIPRKEKARLQQPALQETLKRLEAMAADYAALCSRART